MGGGGGGEGRAVLGGLDISPAAAAVAFPIAKIAFVAHCAI